VLVRFVSEISSELTDNLLGVYLVGSLAIGDFDLDSDIDFLVITKTKLTEANIRNLPVIQTGIQEMGYYPAQHLEGSFIPIADLNDWQIIGEKEFPYFDNGSTTLEYSNHDNQWHVRWVLRERGVPLVGPNPVEFMQPIPQAEMASEIKTTMLQCATAFEGDLDHPLGFLNSRFGQSFIILTYCRMLQTLQTGSVQSKKAAVMWAREFIDPRWVELIDQAWEERRGVRFMEKIHQRAEQALLCETLDFIKYAVSHIDSFS
jgi:hypothetical protein